MSKHILYDVYEFVYVSMHAHTSIALSIPRAHVGLSAQGPITATLLYLLKSSGRTLFRFSIRTIDSFAVHKMRKSRDT